MDYSEFERLLLELIKEQEIKLGYVYGSTRLYFLETYLCSLLGITSSQLPESLKTIGEHVQNQYGVIQLRAEQERICIEVSAQVCEYVRNNIPANPFLVDLVELCQKHKVTPEDVRALFVKYSQDFTWDNLNTDDIDCLISFQNKTITPYYYGIKWNGTHISYHRYLESDLPDLRD